MSSNPEALDLLVPLDTRLHSSQTPHPELKLPVALCVSMLLMAGVTSWLAGIQFTGLFVPYLATGLAVTFVCALGFIFVEVAKLAPARTDGPLAIAIAKLRERLPFLVLPAVILPIFLAGFTAAKTAIPFLVGYSWDPTWAAADRFVFGDDAWRIAQQLLGTSNSRFWEWFYTVGWGYALFFGSAVVALFAPRKTIGIYFSAMFGTWIIGGCFLAYMFASVGPVFAGHFEPSLRAEFAGLQQFIDTSLRGGPIQNTQSYLLRSAASHVAVKGGGISAMPSMHLGAATIFLLVSRRTLFLYPALIFWAVIFICSGYFGYHYWTDSLAGALVAWICWLLATAAHRQA